jgi:predicted DNA binding CopG/RHH family protein
MLNKKDQEHLTKASHSASFLVQDLSDLVKSTNPLMSDIALEILQQSTQVELRLKRLLALVDQPEEA